MEESQGSSGVSQGSNRSDDRRKGKAPIAHVPLAKDEQNFPPTGKYSFNNFWKIGNLKVVSSERVFDEKLMNYINFKYLKSLKNWGWWDFIVNPTYKTRAEMVKAFYWNGKIMDVEKESSEVVESEDTFNTNVCGVNFSVSVNDVREMIGENVVRGDEVTPPKNHDVKTDFLAMHEFLNDVANMNMHKRILFMIISQVLLVRNDRLHEPSGEDLWWMGKIIREDPPDLCAAIFLRIRNSLKNAHNKTQECICMDDVCLPYGKLVTRIIEKKLDYNINRREPFSTWSLDEPEPFDVKAFTKMCPRYNPLIPPPSY